MFKQGIWNQIVVVFDLSLTAHKQNKTKRMSHLFKVFLQVLVLDILTENEILVGDEKGLFLFTVPCVFVFQRKAYLQRMRVK